MSWLSNLFRRRNKVPEPIGYPPIPLRGTQQRPLTQVGTTSDDVPIVMPSIIPENYLPVGAVNVPAVPQTPVIVPEAAPTASSVERVNTTLPKQPSKPAECESYYRPPHTEDRS